MSQASQALRRRRCTLHSRGSLYTAPGSNRCGYRYASPSAYQPPSFPHTPCQYAYLTKPHPLRLTTGKEREGETADGLPGRFVRTLTSPATPAPLISAHPKPTRQPPSFPHTPCQYAYLSRHASPLHFRPSQTDTPAPFISAHPKPNRPAGASLRVDYMGGVMGRFP